MENTKIFETLKREVANAKTAKTLKVIDKAGRNELKKYSSEIYSKEMRKKLMHEYKLLHKACMHRLKELR